MSNSNQSSNGRTHDEAFLSSMSFSSMGCCGCDECDAISLRQKDGQSKKDRFFVSDPVLRTIQEPKRQRVASSGAVLKLNQDRTLRKRGARQISVWKWTLPPDSNPLIEYGTSHRLVWVERLAPGRTICSIGNSPKGEENPPPMGWEEGKLYLVPSRQGKAVGWTNVALHGAKEEKQDGDDSDTDGIVLTIAKVPPSALNQVQTINSDAANEEPPEKTWENALQEECGTLLRDRHSQATEKDDPVSSVCVENPHLVELLKQCMLS
eukprot:CAMPEP_0168739584 /NCGR_PEP_ID=MMETSP0724-20121128/11539_1 /TAXON_ID=265536 /ORGANISM="Amphiprora sp., Strain CCMP467" /LENGTH=264 /DNA_ID=CAMNT_0008786993 /DNA_START=44 /DNA_END=838 /DNA_ORIENTATION=+